MYGDVVHQGRVREGEDEVGHSGKAGAALDGASEGTGEDGGCGGEDDRERLVDVKI